MFQSLKSILSIDIEKELPYIVTILKDKRERESITEANCQRALQLGFRFILLTDPKSQQVNYLLHIGWKLLEGVGSYKDIAKDLVHPDIVKDLRERQDLVNCNRSETIKVIRWIDKTVGPIKEPTMAVKKHEITHDNTAKADLALLAQQIESQSDLQTYFNSTNEWIVWWKNIVIFLARVQIPKDPSKLGIFYTQVSLVENFLQRLIAGANPDIRNEVVFAILKQLYSIISSQESEPCPAACVVLSVVRPGVIESAVGWLIRSKSVEIKDWPMPDSSQSLDEDMPGVVEAADSSTDGDIGLRNSLTTLCHWLCTWHQTPILGDWVLAFIKALQASRKFDILVEVSLEVITQLADALLIAAARPLVFNIFLYILASMRNTMAPFQKIALKIPEILEKLASDSSPNTRAQLHNLVETLSALLDQNPALKSQHSEIVSRLNSHIKSSKCSLLDFPVWHSSSPKTAEDMKVGLVNLGNTCYMNSVLQALHLTKEFSNLIMLKEDDQFIVKLGGLLACLIYSPQTQVNPSEFYVLAKPPLFNRGSQHDSSEFLGYLLDRLHEKEKYYLALLPDKCRGVPKFFMPLRVPEQADISNIREVEEGPSEASCSSSLKAISIGRNKRLEDSDNPAGKRKCTGIDQRRTASPDLYFNTIVQRVFGGISTTTIRCSVCGTESVKTDSFRDIQLAFPENKTCHHIRGRSVCSSVQELLDYYFKVEMLCEQNRYFCETCNSLQDAERSISLNRAPNNLILVIKHFAYDPKAQVRSKLNHKVNHNCFVDIQENNKSVSYNLYAGIVHAGTNLDSGHYFTIGRDGPDEWYKYNDHFVSRAYEDTLQKMAASHSPYILFYKRVCTPPDNIMTDASMEMNNSSPDKIESEQPYFPEGGTESGTPKNLEYNIKEQNIPYELLPKIHTDLINAECSDTRKSRHENRSVKLSLKGSNPRTHKDNEDDAVSYSKVRILK